mmetsp:Transcript_1829/g.3742  ORF Transcript_1829/g.3742 Transcript_1829/m.3742 type:complete len:413 (-) Transcript_1829:54-1292(-)
MMTVVPPTPSRSRNNDNDNTRISLGQRLAWEWKDTSRFNLMEPNGRVLNVPLLFANKKPYWRGHDGDSFTPCHRRSNRAMWKCPSWLLLYRVAAWVGTVSYFFWSLLEHHTLPINRLVFLAFFTRWNLVLILLYQGLVVLLTIRPEQYLFQPPVVPCSSRKDSDTTTMNPGEKKNQETKKNVQSDDTATTTMIPLLPHPLVRLVWILHSALVPIQLIVVPVYWILGYGREARGYETRNMAAAFIDHGIVSLLFLLDGMIWHRLPIRLRHIGLPYAILLSYAIFYLIYDLTTSIGNGTYGWEPENDSSSVYEQNFDKDQWPRTVLGMAFMGAVYLPTMYGLCWCTSLLSCRHSSSLQDSSRLGKSCCGRQWSLDGSHRPALDVVDCGVVVDRTTEFNDLEEGESGLSETVHDV